MADDITEDLDKYFERRIQDKEYRAYMAYSARRNRQRNTLLIVAAVAVATFSFLLRSNSFDLPSATYSIVAVALAGVLLSGFALLYLQPSPARESSSSWFDPYQARAYVEVMIKDAVEELKRNGSRALEFSDKDRESVLTSIRAKVEAESAQLFIDGLKGQMLAQLKEETFDSRFEQMRRRIAQEVRDLAKRGNVSLILGMVTTLVGVTVLAYAVFNPPASSTNYQLIAHYGSRVSLVLLIELFAYFFLKLYKDSLLGIKYFQNELTNIESKQLALQVTMSLKDRELVAKVIEQLAVTERNNQGQGVPSEDERILSKSALSLLAKEVVREAGKSAILK